MTSSFLQCMSGLRQYFTVCLLPCEEGYEANDNCTICVLADICLGENPCKNQGQCTLVNKPDVYECECVGPGNYTGKNCTG